VISGWEAAVLCVLMLCIGVIAGVFWNEYDRRHR
jgi:ABC-type phosphate transport system permease subunit